MTRGVVMPRVRSGGGWLERLRAEKSWRAPAARALCALLVVGAGRAVVADTRARAEIVAEVRIHGNVNVPDAEVLRLAGVGVGDTLGADSIAQIEQRLRNSGRFDVVEVRKRYRSLDMQEVALVLLVHEPPAPAGPLLVRPIRRALTQSMFLPILDYDEGYGFTYGARVSTVDWLHGGERISVPLTWGGTKRAAVEVDRTFATGPLTRVLGGAGVWTRENPHYELDDHRVELRARAERRIARPLRLGVEASRADVNFGALNRSQWMFGADIAVDTRGDPTFPANAIYAATGWQSLRVQGAPEAINRYRAEARGYVRVTGQWVVAVRAQYDGADRPLPPYERSLLGGISTLRGHSPGEFAGDRRVVTSAEIRVPLDSPVGFGRAGVSMFYDAGMAWNVGQRRQDVPVQQGAGAGVFLTASFFQIDLDVAKNLSGRGGRLHVAAGFSF
jgi:outer membrane protein assembly factor BamA